MSERSKRYGRGEVEIVVLLERVKENMKVPEMMVLEQNKYLMWWLGRGSGGGEGMRWLVATLRPGLPNRRHVTSAKNDRRNENTRTEERFDTKAGRVFLSTDEFSADKTFIISFLRLGHDLDLFLRIAVGLRGSAGASILSFWRGSEARFNFFCWDF